MKNYKRLTTQFFKGSSAGQVKSILKAHKKGDSVKVEEFVDAVNSGVITLVNEGISQAQIAKLETLGITLTVLFVLNKYTGTQIKLVPETLEAPINIRSSHFGCDIIWSVNQKNFSRADWESNLERDMIVSMQTFISDLCRTQSEYYTSEFPNLPTPGFNFQIAKKYIKVWKRNNHDDTHGAIIAFIDKQNGNVYKPAGCKAPAKHVRGNIHCDPIQNYMSVHGVHYLR